MYRVIIVDDEPVIRRGLRETVEWDSLGLEVAGEAADGIEALKLIRDIRPEILITDIRMPDMDGIQLIRAVKALDFDVKITILSGYSDYNYLKAAIQLGVDNYLLKPIDNDELISNLKNAVSEIEKEAVIDLQISPGKVEAKVQGRRKTPYKVEIRIGRLNEDSCQKIIDRCTTRIESLETLVKGEFPEELKDIFTEKGGLFPTPKEISFACSCPDWAMMCKHVAAVMYGIGLRFDENPFYFFTLRGIDADRFIDVALENSVEKMLSNAGTQSERIVSDVDVTELFGVI